MSSEIDLSLLPAPDIVEALNYEDILGEMLADLRSRDTEFSALLESDPAYKILEVAAFRELIIRQRVNEATKAVMLAFAGGADLDQIGANYDVPRLEQEADADYKKRIQLALEGVSTAGPEGAYIFHGLTADGDVKDVGVESPNPGEVVISILSRTGDGTQGCPIKII